MKSLFRLLAAVPLFYACSAFAQNAQPLWQPHQFFVDGSGNPCAGCALYSYAAGTTTPQATYTSAARTTPNPNPVILDATGSWSIWIGSLAYKFALLDTNGTTLWTVDNVLAPAPGVAGTAYLPLTGGTLTGLLTAPYFQFTSNSNSCTSGNYVIGWASGGWTCGIPQAAGAAAGDLSGSYPNPTVVRINGAIVPASAGLLGSNGSSQLISQTGTITNSTSGNAATATALATTPTNCTIGNTAYGISANGNALCNSGGGPTLQQALVITSGICTTGTSAYAQCASTAANWPTAFSDTAYGVTCTGVGMMTGNVSQMWVSTKSTTSVTLSLQNGSASGAVASTFAEIDCIGKHN